jgi:hypothetical protein
MIIDKELELALAAPVFSTGSTVYLEDVAGGNDIDFGAKGDSHPDQLWVVVRVSTAFAGGTSAEFKIVTDTALPIDGSSVVLGSSGAIVVADLTVDTRVWAVKVPLNKLRYLSLATTCVGTVTAGSIDVHIVKNLTDNDFSA